MQFSRRRTSNSPSSPLPLQALILPALIALLLTFTFIRPDENKQAPDNLKIALEKAVQTLQPGKIAFESPINMHLNQTKLVEVRIGQHLTQDLTQGFAKNAHVEVNDIRIGPLMAAKLNGSAFQITPLTKEAQALADDNFTTWDWSIHPLDWGKQTLYLSVCVRLQLRNDKEEQRCSPVYQKDIAVQVAPGYAATHFIKNNATWTLGAMGTVLSALCTGIVWIAKRLKKQKGTILDP